MKKLGKQKEARSSATMDLTSEPSTSKARMVFNQPYIDGDYFPLDGGSWVWQGGSANHLQGHYLA